MKAITICQPFAHLIISPPEELKGADVPKRVENRMWATDYRGDLLIHAGKGRKWLRDGDEARYPDMLFGYVVGICELVDCVANTTGQFPGPLYSERWLTLTSDLLHADSESPFWWLLDRVERFPRPVKMRGQLKLWECPGEWIRPSVRENKPTFDKPRRKLRIKQGSQS